MRTRLSEGVGVVISEGSTAQERKGAVFWSVILSALRGHYYLPELYSYRIACYFRTDLIFVQRLCVKN